MEVQYLRSTITDNSLKEKIKHIEKMIAPLLARTTNITTDMTEHNLDHCLHIESIYFSCFHEINTILSDQEKFLLIIATLIHDIGMVGQAKYKHDDEYESEIRDSHQYRSADFIREYKVDLGLDTRDSELIAKIAESHRGRNLETLMEKEPYGYGGIIRTRLLGALLRLGDELDILEERAPQLVKKYLDVNPESLIHHERHQIFTGIYREDNVIYLRAVVPTKKLEDSVWELFNGISKKLEQTRAILNSHQISLKDINLILDVERVVLQEVLLTIIKCEPINEEELIRILVERDKRDIEEALKQLYSVKIVIKQDDKLTVSSQDKHFHLILRTFIRTEYELDFAKSHYVKKYLENRFNEYANDKYGVIYDVGDRHDRLLILTHFPTSLDYFFDNRSFEYEFGNIERRSTLELGLLHAISIDILRYPDELKGEVFLAAQAIQKSVSEHIMSFLNICSAIPKAKEKKAIITSTINNETDENIEKAAGSFTITSKEPAQLLPGLDFFTLYLASGISGEPISFNKGVALKDIKFNGKDLDSPISGDMKFQSIKLEPQNDIEPVEIVTLFRFDLDKERRELVIELMGQEEDIFNTNYPFQLEITFDSTRDLNFKVNCNQVNNINFLTSYYEMLEMWSKEGLRRLYIDKCDGSDLISCVPVKIKFDGYNFHKKLVDLFRLNSVQIDNFPPIIPKKIIETLNSTNTENKESLISIFQELSKNISKQQSKVFFTVRDKEGKYLLVDFLGYTPYWMDMGILNLRFDRGDAKEIKKGIKEGKYTFSLESYLCNISHQDFHNQVREIFKKRYPLENVFTFISNNKGDQVTIKTKITLSSKKSSYWCDLQEVEIAVILDDEEIYTANRLHEFLSNDDFINAIPLMEKLNKSRHLENLAFAYCVSGEFEKAFNKAEEAIKKDPKSVAHFTKGLALVLSGQDGYESYMNGVYLVDSKTWYPKAIENLKMYLEKRKMPLTNNITRIINDMKQYRNINRSKAKCFCGSRKKYVDCHGLGFIKK